MYALVVTVKKRQVVQGGREESPSGEEGMRGGMGLWPEPHTTRGAAWRNVGRGFMIGMLLWAARGCH